jgi:O-antigen/teichoic acid export membrane protein
MSEMRPGAETRRFGRTASLLSAGVGVAGLLTYLFFSLASHNLDATEYGEIVVLWSAVFVTISVAYRPVEQLLSRTLADRIARGEDTGPAIRTAARIQLAVSVGLAIAILLFRDPLQDGLLSGSETLYWVLFASVVCFGASFFLRGYLGGIRRFNLLAALLVAESGARTLCALALALGIAEGQTAVALGVAAAPLVSLALVPVLVLTRPGKTSGEPERSRPISLAAGGGFAGAVLVIMIGEQVFLNAGPLLVRAFEDAAAAGFIFNILMVARAPVLIFQGVSASLLPHLTRMRARGGEDAFHSSVRATITVVAWFATATLAVMVAVGPALMQIAFGDRFEYDRIDLAIMAVGMGFYLAATTLSQAALARGAAATAARSWGFSAAVFLVWALLPVVEDEALRIEVGFAAGAALLAFLLARTYQHAAGEGMVSGSPEELEAQIAALDEGA